MNFHGFDVRHLAILDMLLTELHVGRAAQRLHLSQPAVSNALAWMRRHFGDPLLVRSGRSLRPTPFAERLRDPVRRLLVDFRAVALGRPGFEASTATRLFRITLSEYAAAMIIARLLQRVAAVAPGVRIECRPISSDINEFERGEIDLLVMAWEVLHQHHPRVPLFSDEWVCVACGARGDLPAALSADDYRAARHVLPDIPQAIGRELDAIGVRRDVAAVVPHALLPEVVAGTPWLATVPRGLVRSKQAGSALHVRPLSFALPPAVVGMQWHRDSADEPATQWLRALVRDVVAEIGLAPPPARKPSASGLAPVDGRDIIAEE